MHWRRICLLVVVAGLGLSGATSAQWDDVEIKAVSVSTGVWMLEGRGGNIGVSAGEDGVLLIDDQFAPLGEKIKAAVKRLSDDPIRFVVNTHWHGDHTGGNESLGQGGAVIVAHENVRKQMSLEHLWNERTIPVSPDAALPVITFVDSVTFHMNGESIRVIHLPAAHTDGDSLIHFPGANVLHMGDVYFNGMYPFIDVSSGGSIDGVIAAVERALEIADAETKIIPGHGPLSNRKELARYGDMLAKIRGAIAPLVEAGRSLEQVQAAKPTAEFDEALGGGFINPEQMVENVYTSLSK